ncbi:pyridoxamine 5'-phosphate oxidase family protein, partial [Rhizobium ruizarguesonis]
ADIVRAIKPGSRAHFCVIGKDHDYHSCLAGVIEVHPDPSNIEEYWSSIVAAWYDAGMDIVDLIPELKCWMFLRLAETCHDRSFPLDG